MPYSSWTSALAPKLQGTLNLHNLLPKGMSFFIMLSSIAGAIGSTAQANYAAGCSYQDALAHYRTGLGEKATTLNLGLMLDDGVLTENANIRKVLLSTGYLMGIRQSELYALLERYCDPSAPVSKPLDTQIIVGIDVPAKLKAEGIDPPIFMRRPPFRLFYNISSGTPSSSSSDPNGPSTINLPALLAPCKSVAEAASIISDALIAKLSKALAIPIANFDSSKPMHAYGVDSLVAVELRNWFSQVLEADVAVFEILGEGRSFEDLGTLVAGKSRVVMNVIGAGGEGSGEAVNEG